VPERIGRLVGMKVSEMARGKTVLLLVGVAAVAFAATLAALRLNQSLGGVERGSAWRRPGGQLLPASTEANGPLDFRAAAKRVLPSVVSVDTQIEGETWFGDRVRQQAGSGSGVVISADGYIVTNNHVVRVQTWGGQRLVDEVNVTFSDGRSLAAKVVGADPSSDLAVLKVQATGLTPIQQGDSSKLEVGQWVIAMGNPLGYENTLSVGVVSNIGRPLPSDGTTLFIDGIQTDAAINMGNSGGALCDSEGNLVGINTAIASIGGGNIGLGFAIPVNRMRQVVDDIVKFGYAKYGQLGISLFNRDGALAMPAAREELKRLVETDAEPPEAGVLIRRVAPGSAAAGAGLKPWDVVIEVDGRAVRELADFQAVMSPKRPGDKVSLTVWSAGKKRTVQATLTDSGRSRVM
jgi:serine protease Do